MSERQRNTNVVPDSPGVYFFLAKSGQKNKNNVLYVGKARNLKARLSSYFRNKNLDPRKKEMLKESESIDWEELGSETEALIREAELIKKHRPKYNVSLRDDKQYFYVGFTAEEFPKIFLTHQPDKTKKAAYVGPFTDGQSIKLVLKTIRAIFPYCQCGPESKIRHLRPCQQSEIGRCLGVCCLKKEMWRKFYGGSVKKRVEEYKNNIKLVKKIISGKHQKVSNELEKEMKKLSRDKQFEDAAQRRNQIYALNNIFAHRFYLGLEREIWRQKGLKHLAELLGIADIRRVEAYDISNISGQNAAGAMAVFSNGMPDKNEYRRFRIRLPEKPDDPAMIKEIVSRRLSHQEWRYPEIIVVDGGKTQLNAAQLALKSVAAQNAKKIKIVALAKKNEELYLPGGKIVKLKEGPEPLLRLLQSIRDEAHRFAVSYHRRLRSVFK